MSEVEIIAILTVIIAIAFGILSSLIGFEVVVISMLGAILSTSLVTGTKDDR